MFELKAYINAADGRISTDRVKLDVRGCEGGVNAVFVNALSEASHWKDWNGSIDSEKGICIEIGLKEEIKRYMAIYRYCEFWCKPFFGEEFKEVPDETQALVLETEDSRYCVILPVVNDTWKCVLQGKDTQTITARVYSWYQNLYTCKGLSFVYAVGERPSELMRKCVSTALELLNNGIRTREERKYPETLEYLGWCSWDSMQIRVNEDGILEKCEEFRKKQIPVKWAILDDMWGEVRDFYGQEYQDFTEMMQLMHRSSLYHFEADPIRFPKGLAHCISKVKEYGIKVGMWHPTTGYWRGIDPEGRAYELLKDYLIETKSGYYIPDWHNEKSYLYFKTIHDYMRKCGVDFVKIDNQSVMRKYYKGLAPVGKLARAFHDGMEASVGEHFANGMINCMGMASEDMWTRSVSSVSRCSADFMPEDKEWFVNHILQCAYNSILQGEFYWCDWDMWWTDDGQAGKNSLMRAISGGPVYVSDQLDRSRTKVLEPLALSDGMILRCDRPCTPTYDCVTVDPIQSGQALKLQNMVGEYGIMAVLNLDKDERPVTGRISGAYIDGFKSDEYAVYEHYSRELRILKKGEYFDIILSDADDYRLYILAPIHNGFAAIGRVDKFISPKTIKSVFGQKIQLKEEGPCAYVLDGKLYIND